MCVDDYNFQLIAGQYFFPEKFNRVRMKYSFTSTIHTPIREQTFAMLACGFFERNFVECVFIIFLLIFFFGYVWFHPII